MVMYLVRGGLMRFLKKLLMRKKTFMELCFIIFVVFGIWCIKFYTIDDSIKYPLPIEAFNTYFEPGEPSEGSVEELYQDIFILMLLPEIEKAVEDYYGRPYFVAPYQVKILNVGRPNGYRTFGFILKLEILPYEGPHNSVGKDHITIKIEPGPTIQVEKFEHIESYDIPQNIKYTLNA